MHSDISEESLLSFSHSIQKTATAILNESGIIELLAEHGEPLIIGSYALGVMIDEDIDIVVKTSTPKLSAQQVLSKLINREVGNKYEFGDFVKFPRENRPNGYIVNLKLPHSNAYWELETWFLDDTRFYSDQLKSFKDRLDKKKITRILLRKYHRKQQGLTKAELNSTKIYNEVLGFQK